MSEIVRRPYDDQTAFQRRLRALNMGALWVVRSGVDLSFGLSLRR